ncbi:DUF4349 domain-containing protein [Patulibacter americanus]|uniref:DUF4349 domain-containing protein n=1 Tax=Patulibacter americanus TaxID=588672 RepID=UPI0003B67AB5|nr:DUF4349 domain-containing protein [Patulibacter americanus]
MLRSDRRLDPAIQDELDALDAALRGETSAEQPAPAEADRAGHEGDTRHTDGLGAAPGSLATLVSDVRATRPALDAEARARLDERAAETRAAQRAPRREPVAPRAARRRRVALGLAAAVAVAIPVGGVATDGWFTGDDGATYIEDLSSGGELERETEADQASGATTKLDQQSGEGDGPAPTAAESPRPASGASTATGTASAAPSRSAGTPPDLSADRRVIRNVRQTVRVAPDGVARAAARVSTVAEDAGGYLASSSVRERGDRAGGSFDVVVPVGRLDATVAALGRIGRPVRLSRSSTDVTEQAASLQDRLDDERADRAALRLQLARTVDADRRAARRRELRLRSSRIAGLEAERDALRGRTATARIALRLTTQEDSAAAPPPKVDDGRWGLGDAWRDAGRVVEVGAGVALVGAVVLLPVALLLGGGVVLRRRAAAAGRDRVIGRA